MSIIDENDTSVEAATGYTDAFLDAAILKLDATFGAGFARANPALLGAMIQASASTLNSLMQAAMAVQADMFDGLPEDFDDLAEEMFEAPPAKPKKGRR